MPKFEVVHYYEYTRRFEIEAENEEEAERLSHNDKWDEGAESDCHTLHDTIINKIEEE